MSTLRCAGRPSSSIAKQPHSPPIVPSSTSVTSGDATCSPRRPANTEAPLLTRSASSPWPQASWNITPPPPGPMTTVISPDGAGRASSLVIARCAAAWASSRTSYSSKSSKPTVRPTDSLPVCIPASPDATHDTENSVLTWSSPARVPSLLATRIRRRESAYRAATWVIAAPSERAISSAATSSSTLRALGTSPGCSRTAFGSRRVDPVERDHRRAGPRRRARPQRRCGPRPADPARSGRRCGRSRSSPRRPRGYLHPGHDPTSAPRPGRRRATPRRSASPRRTARRSRRRAPDLRRRPAAPRRRRRAGRPMGGRSRGTRGSFRRLRVAAGVGAASRAPESNTSGAARTPRPLHRPVPTPDVPVEPAVLTVCGCPCDPVCPQLPR